MRRATLFMLTALTLAPVARAAEVLPFIQNDYQTALARAKTKHLPIFVEAWAPW
jgi:hypothetical protein